MSPPSKGRPSRRKKKQPHPDSGTRLIKDILADARSLDHITVIIFLSSAALLAIYYYFAQPTYFDRNIAQYVAPGEWKGLFRFVWWSGGGIIIRMILPLTILLFMRQSPSNFGYRIRGIFTWNHVKIYLILYLAMLPVLYAVSFTEAFQSKYPFYKDSLMGLDHLLLFEVTYLLQFVALEAFFRGYLLFGLEKKFGHYSLFIMAIPYCMIHFGKPLPETLGAIFAGLILGYLALRSRTFWFGVILHWAVGFTMDILALVRKM